MVRARGVVVMVVAREVVAMVAARDVAAMVMARNVAAMVVAREVTVMVEARNVAVMELAMVGPRTDPAMVRVSPMLDPSLAVALQTWLNRSLGVGLLMGHITKQGLKPPLTDLPPGVVLNPLQKHPRDPLQDLFLRG